MPKKKTTNEETSIKYSAETTKMNVRIIFTEELLGSCPSDPEVYKQWVADKASDKDMADEIAAYGADKILDNGTTRFLTVDGRPALSNHTWLGFFKEKCGFIKLDNKNTACGKLSNYRKRFDTGAVAFENKFSVLVLPKGEQLGMCQRPLRAQTQQGERIALASSVTCPIGTRTRFTLFMTSPEYKPVIEETLNMGRFVGTGQWRGSGKRGTFLWEEFTDDGEIVGGNTMALLGVTTKDPNFKDVFTAFINHTTVGDIEEDFD